MVDKHIGVSIFKILKENKKLNQTDLMARLSNLGYNKHQSYLYIKYILSVPMPIGIEELTGNLLWSEPMIIRCKNETNNTVIISLNEYWVETDEKDVIELFANCNPDDY